MKSTTLTLIAIFLTSVSACTKADTQDTQDTQDTMTKNINIERQISENLQAVRKALIEMETIQNQDDFSIIKTAIYNDPRDFSFGSQGAKVTIVAFFDYNCSFCKNSSNWLKGVMDKHPESVRIIFKELPLLDRRTKTSRNASIAALAAARQDKYLNMHFALMESQILNDKQIMGIATKLNLDLEQFKTDIEDSALNLQIEDGLLLSTRIPYIQGTPFFIINEHFVAGGNIAALDQILQEKLNEG